MTAGAVGYSRRRFMGLTAIAAVTWGCYSALIGIGAGAWLHDHTLVAVAVGVVGGLAIGLVVDWVLRHLRHRPAAGERTSAPRGRRADAPRAEATLRSQDAHDPTPLPNDPVSPGHFPHDCAYSLTVSTSRSALPRLSTPPGVSIGMGRCRQGARWACVRGGPSASRCPLPPAGPRACSAARADGTGRTDRGRRGAADCLSPQVLADLGLVAAGETGGRHAARRRPRGRPRARRLPPGERGRLRAGRHAAGLVRDLGGADGEPARGRPRRARRGPASAVRAARRHVQHAPRSCRRRSGWSTPWAGRSGRCGRRTGAARPGDGGGRARRARGDRQRAVPRAARDPGGADGAA